MKFCHKNDIIKLGDNMNDLLNLILSLGALLIGGLICSFFVILNIHKKEIWEELYEKYNGTND